ncbi:MAG: hypothetical protein WKG07_10690 [Hymenobacter sp.]
MRFDRILYVRLMSQGTFVLGVVGLLFVGERPACCTSCTAALSSVIASVATLVAGLGPAGQLAAPHQGVHSRTGALWEVQRGQLRGHQPAA